MEYPPLALIGVFCYTLYILYEFFVLISGVSSGAFGLRLKHGMCVDSPQACLVISYIIPTPLSKQCVLVAGPGTR